MLNLTKADMTKLFTMKEAIAASKEALKIASRGECAIPLRTSIDITKEQGQALFMPAYVSSLDIIGVKIVSVFSKNIERGKPAVIADMMLLDGKTGETLARLDGTYLTQLRTGALQGAATDLLAEPTAEIAVLFGAGGQASTQLEALLNVRQLKEVRVLSDDFSATKTFVTAMQKQFSHFSTNIVAMDNPEAALKDADIVTTVTRSNTPVFDGNLITEGMHINGIGAYTPTMQELPESLITKANKIFFDTSEGVLAEAGDIIIPLKKGLISKNDLNGDLGQVYLGQTKGRETEKEITVFKSVGTAVLDVVTAFFIYQKAIL